MWHAEQGPRGSHPASGAQGDVLGHGQPKSCLWGLGGDLVVGQDGAGNRAWGHQPLPSQDHAPVMGTITAQNRDTASLMSMHIIGGERGGEKIKAGILQRWYKQTNRVT